MITDGLSHALPAGVHRRELALYLAVKLARIAPRSVLVTNTKLSLNGTALFTVVEVRKRVSKALFLVASN